MPSNPNPSVKPAPLRCAWTRRKRRASYLKRYTNTEAQGMLDQRIRSVAIAISLLLFFGPATAQDEPERAPQEKKELAVKLATFLENNPFHESAKEARSWFTAWLIEVPDITVKVCGSFHGPYFEKSKKYSSELLGQTLYGQAAFIIQNPDRTADDLAIYRAGLTSSLRAYQSILGAKPNARDKFLDDLVVKIERGEIDKYVQAKMQECE